MSAINHHLSLSQGLILNPQSWSLPDITPSSLSSLSIQKEVKEHGLAYRDFTLDMGETGDPCLKTQIGCLSQSDLTGIDRTTPVVLLAHGFSATSYEWKDFANYIDKNLSDFVLYSKIVLGGHGRSLEAFKKSNWVEWGKPILDEYQALVAHGFTNISLAGSSTACALILEQLSSGAYQELKVYPKNIFFVDPIVEPLSLMNSIAVRIGAIAGKAFGPVQAFSPEEFSYWHGYRPFSSLKSLDDLTRKVKRALASGILLPSGTKLSIWASQKDPTVDPLGYQVIERGTKPGHGGSVNSYPIDSKFHVFTRLSGRPQATEEDQALISGDVLLSPEMIKKQVLTRPIPFTPDDRLKQKQTFDQMLTLVVAKA